MAIKKMLQKMVRRVAPGSAVAGNGSTASLPPGQYLLYFTLTGDPVPHAATFIIAK
jgi:hypothetical protein